MMMLLTLLLMVMRMRQADQPERIPATQPRDAVGFGSERMYTKTSRRRQLQSAIPLIPLLDKQQFHRIAANVGDVTLCRQSVPHYGTRNNSSRSGTTNKSRR